MSSGGNATTARGRCPACGRDLWLTSLGNLRYHKPRHLTGRNVDWCDGSGIKPLEANVDVPLTIEKIAPGDFCMLVPNPMLPEDDMRPEQSQPLLRDLFAAMKTHGWLFVDWGECHGTHSEAWFIREMGHYP